jgi:hypothetical protein
MGVPIAPVRFCDVGDTVEGDEGVAGEVIETVRSAFTSVLLPLIVTE